MKISLVFILLLLLSFFVSIAFAQIQITEIMYNPNGSDDGREWIEAINSGNSINVKTGRDGWKLNDGKNHYLQTNDFTWNSNQVIIFVQDKSKFLKDYPSNPANIVESSFYLKNSSGSIKILNENQNVISETSYTDIADDGFSIIFKNNNGVQGNKNGTPGVYPDAVFQNSNNQTLEQKQETETKSAIVGKESTNNTQIENNANQQSLQINQQASLVSEISTSSTSTFSFSPNLFINEFLPNTEGKDDNEFIELLNSDEKNINLSDFSIKVGDKNIKLKGESAQKFIVLWKKAYGFNIRNKGEIITLLFNGKETHKISYNNKSPEGKSFSKIGNSWVWTEPTPSSENIFVENVENDGESSKSNQNNLTTDSTDEYINNEAYQENLLAQTQKIQNNNLKNKTSTLLIVGVFLAIILSAVAILIIK